MSFKDLLTWGAQYPEAQATLALLGAFLTVILGVYKSVTIVRRMRNPPPEPLDIATAAAHIAIHGTPPSADKEKSIADYDKIIAEHHDDANAYVGRARLLADNGELDLAIADLSEALRLKSSLDVLLQRADIHARKNDIDATVEDLRNALVIDPKSIGALTRLSRAYTAKKEYSAAIAKSDEALQLNPTSADAYAERAAARIQLEQFDAAIADASHAIRIDPNHYRGHLFRGLAYKDTNRFREALSAYDAAISIDPNEPDAFFLCGLTHQNMGNDLAAVAHYGKTLSLNPNSQPAREYLLKLLTPPKKGWFG